MRLLDSECSEPVLDTDDGSDSQGPAAKQNQDALARFVQAGRVILTADLESKLQEVELRVFGSLDERFTEQRTKWSRELEFRVFGSLDARFSELRTQWIRELQEEVTRQLSRRQEAEGSRLHDSHLGIRDSHSANKQWPRRTPPAPGKGGKGSNRTPTEDNSVNDRLKRLEGIVGGLVAAAANAEVAKQTPPEALVSSPSPMKPHKGAGRRPPPLEPEDGGCSPDSGSGPLCDSDVARQLWRMRSSNAMTQSPQSPGSPDPELEQILARRRSISEGLLIPPMPAQAEADLVQEVTVVCQPVAGQQDSPMIGRAETDEEAHLFSPPGPGSRRNSGCRAGNHAPGEQHHLSVSSLSATTDEEAAPGDEHLPLRWRQRRQSARSRSNSSGGLLQDTASSHHEVLGDSAATLDVPVVRSGVAKGGTPQEEVQSPVQSLPPSPCGKKFRHLKQPTSGTMSPAISFGTLPSGSPSVGVAWEPAPSPSGCSPKLLPAVPNLQHLPAAWESGHSSPSCSVTCPPHSGLPVAVPTMRKPPPQVVVLPPAVEVTKQEVTSPTRVQSSPALFRCETMSAPMTATMTRIPRAAASPLKVTVRGHSMQSMQPLLSSGRTMSRHRLVDDRASFVPRSVRQSAASWYTPPRPQLAPSQSVHLEGIASSPSDLTAGTSLTCNRPLSGSTNLMLSPSVNARPPSDTGSVRPPSDTGSSRWAPTPSGQRLGSSPSPPRSSKTGSAAIPANAMERVAPRAATPHSRNPGSSPPQGVVRTPRLVSPGSSPPVP